MAVSAYYNVLHTPAIDCALWHCTEYSHSLKTLHSLALFNFNKKVMACVSKNKYCNNIALY